MHQIFDRCLDKFVYRFWLDFGSILGPQGGGSPEMLFGCPEGLGKMVPRGPKRPPDDAKTDFDQILVDFCKFFGRFLIDF